MKFNFTVLTLVFLFLFACSPSEPLTLETSTPEPTSTKKPTDATLSSQTPIPTATATPTITIASPTSTPQGETILVTSADDNGPGTFRQALLDAQSSDIITFDPTVFPPGDPVTILLKNKEEHSALPNVIQGGLTIDASNAGVILDGSNTSGYRVNGLEIYSSGNIVQGLQIINFTGSGIALCNGSNNMIGGNRNIGAGPLGQGNLTSKNDSGIKLCEIGSNNIITGNIIGTDVSHSKNWGNTEGVWIQNGMSKNIIGPDNVIANNNQNGIWITGNNTIGNTITQNSIYDNSIGIRIYNKYNNKLDFPHLLNLDMELGTMTGSTCANCIIEIFSDSNNQGKMFEGQVETDEKGIFTYEHGESFTGPNVTATVTDFDSNTSEFIIPISVVYQENNTHPVTKLQHKSSNELEDNRIGIHFTNLWHLEPEVFPDAVLSVDHIVGQGVKRARFSINNGDSDRIQWNMPELTIVPSHDDFITSLSENEIAITYVLSFWDKEFVANGGEISYPRFKTEEEIQRYLDYVRMIVHHFKDRIQSYEIWNEPNIKNTYQWIEVDDYINLVQRTVPVIRQEYPEAKIIVGGVSYIRDEDYGYDYLLGILNSDDIMPIVDAISWHGMYSTSPEYEFHKQYYYNYPSIVSEIKEIASANGFQGEYISDELSWMTPEIPVYPETHHSERKCAKYYARGIIMHLGMDVEVSQFYYVPKEHPMQIVNTIKNLSTVMAGNEPTNLPVTIQSNATIIKNYGFSLSNGDKMLAVWNDGPAVDFDPGIPTTLVIPGFVGWNATAIDVLNGFEQALITRGKNGDLVINNFFLKDYPIIIRLSK